MDEIAKQNALHSLRPYFSLGSRYFNIRPLITIRKIQNAPSQAVRIYCLNIVKNCPEALVRQDEFLARALDLNFDPAYDGLVFPLTLENDPIADTLNRIKMLLNPYAAEEERDLFPKYWIL